jgi:DNA-directed RNA polymerase specialized sigma24 family protein
MPTDQTSDVQDPLSRISAISTLAQLSSDAQIQRYAWAVRQYLMALLRKKGVRRDDVEDAASDVLEIVLKKFRGNLLEKWDGKGKFRFYLKQVVHNAAIDYLRSRGTREVAWVDLSQVTDTDAQELARDWDPIYRHDVVTNALKALKTYQEEHGGNVYYTVIQSVIDEARRENEECAQSLRRTFCSRDLAERLGGDCTADNARQLKNRARRKLVDLVIAEVRLTLDNPGREQLESELADLGLLEFVREQLA